MQPSVRVKHEKKGRVLVAVEDAVDDAVALVETEDEGVDKTTVGVAAAESDHDADVDTLAVVAAESDRVSEVVMLAVADGFWDTVAKAVALADTVCIIVAVAATEELARAVEDVDTVAAVVALDDFVAEAEHEGSAASPTVKQPAQGHAIGAPEPAGQ